MRGIFLLFLFTSTTILVETPHCIADDGFYEQLRKKKNLKPGDADAIRKQTLDENRRSKVNQISAESKADADEVKKVPDVVAGEPSTDKDVDEKDEDKVETAPKVADKPTRGTRPPRNDRGSDSGPAVKVNPGDLDELEFPGETPAPKKK